MISSQRPLRRRAIKLATALLGPDWAHAHAWLPYLKLEKIQNCTNIVYRNRPVTQLSSPGIFAAAAGPQIYIVGSGPSVGQSDLTLLEPHSCLLLNGAIDEIGRQIKTPLAVVIEDERFVWRHFAMLQERIHPNTICFFSVGVIRALCERDPVWLASMRIILLDDIRKPYRLARRPLKKLRRDPDAIVNASGTAGFSGNPERGVFQGGTVAISAFQLAAYARPELIGLVGIDILNADQPRFYEQEGRSAPSGLKRAQKRIADHLRLAIEICTKRGIKVENYSRESILVHCGLPYNARLARKV